jgi:PAS domain S-box-containing protein
LIVSPPSRIHSVLSSADEGSELPPASLQELRPHESRFHELLGGLGAIVWEADPQTHAKTFVSRHAEELLGYPLQDWLGDPGFWVRILHPEDREETIARMHSVANQGGDHMLEYRTIAADGRCVWIRDLVHVVSDWQGRPRGLHGVMVDVSAERRRSQPSPPGGVSDALTSPPRPTGRSGDPLSLRPRRSAPEPAEPAEITDLNEAIVSVEPRLRKLLGESIELRLRLDARQAALPLSRLQVERMLLDLALHGRDSMLQGGVLEIATSAPLGARQLALKVVDSGVGLDVVLRARAFGSLFSPRLPEPSAAVSLAAVAEIAESVGGCMVAANEPGGGTRVEISLPLASSL